MSKKQEESIRNSKNIYDDFGCISISRTSKEILNGFEVWIYGNKLANNYPSCNIFNEDKSIDLTVSIIDWSILNVNSPKNAYKSWDNFTELKEIFDEWLNAISRCDITYKNEVFFCWDCSNYNSELYDFVKNNNIKIEDEDLARYIKNCEESAKYNNEMINKCRKK